MQFRDVIGDNYRIKKSGDRYEVLRVFKTDGIADEMGNYICSADLRPILVFKDLREFEALVINIIKLNK